MTASPFLTLHELVKKARQKLNHDNWDYIVGGAETETTVRRNRLALDTIAFRPRVLRDVSRVDASTSFLGRPLRLIEILEHEIRTCLGLLGVNTWAELDRSYLHAAPAVDPGRTLGAFPLLTLEEQSFY